MTTISNEDTVEMSTIGEPDSKFFGEVTPPVNVEVGGATHPGFARSNNEDHYVAVRRYRSREVLLTNMPPDAYPSHQDNVYAFAVADGVGGAAFGELASELALRTSWELTGRAFKWGFVLSESETKELLEGINVYVQKIHQRIQTEAKEVFKGMGTTLTGVLTIGHDAFVMHVGDSRAYLFRGTELHRLTHDQTLAELMVKAGLISCVDEAAQRFRSTLVNCLGGDFTKVDVETKHLILQDGDQLLLCTDGLTDMVDEAKIAEILNQAQTPQLICDELIQAALDGGGSDNVTAVLGRYAL